MRRRASALVASLVGGAMLAAAATASLSQPPPSAAAAAPPASSPPPSDPQVERGRYLAILGDCAACHTRPGGQPFAGGLALATPFGTIYSSNITPDRDTGLGTWTPDQFYAALHLGKRADGSNLYPAFPYPYFTHVTRADSDAIFAYLKGLSPVSYRAPANGLPFPLNMRFTVSFWNWLNFRPDKTGAVARGDHAGYIVQGLGHCGACHTPKTFLAGDKRGQDWRGGLIANWFAPDLRSEPLGGLHDWSQADIAEFLKTGRNARSNAGGSMTDVIVHSTSQMTGPDLAAVAAYLKAQPTVTPAARPAPEMAEMKAGEAIYVDECSACHGVDGVGTQRLFPPLAHNANVLAADPTTTVRYILSGAQSATTDTRPTASTMPAFDWKLTDQQTAAVATYVRNAWGDIGGRVTGDQVAKIRKAAAARPIRKPSAKI